jgi:hypothetical protein
MKYTRRALHARPQGAGAGVAREQACKRVSGRPRSPAGRHDHRPGSRARRGGAPLSTRLSLLGWNSRQVQRRECSRSTAASTCHRLGSSCTSRRLRAAQDGVSSQGLQQHSTRTMKPGDTARPQHRRTCRHITLKGAQRVPGRCRLSAAWEYLPQACVHRSTASLCGHSKAPRMQVCATSNIKMPTPPAS